MDSDPKYQPTCPDSVGVIHASEFYEGEEERRANVHKIVINIISFFYLKPYWRLRNKEMLKNVTKCFLSIVRWSLSSSGSAALL